MCKLHGWGDEPFTDEVVVVELVLQAIPTAAIAPIARTKTPLK
jgi:hypothetical protein